MTQGPAYLVACFWSGLVWSWLDRRAGVDWTPAVIIKMLPLWPINWALSYWLFPS